MMKKLLRSKLKFTIVSILIFLALFVYFIIQNQNLFPREKELNNLVPIVASAAVSYEVEGIPVFLKIPRINVDTTIEQVEITPQGEVGVPKGPTNVAWFSLGPRPGESGSAVIVGHYGWKDNITAVFDNLYKLQKGDKIYVKDDKGETITFVVRESKRYDPKADASAVFVSNDDKSHLNLITCEGVWNKEQKSYSKRLVIFTDRE